MIMQLTNNNVKITGSNRRYVLDQIQKFADRFSDRKFSSIELVNLYTGRANEDVHAINAYDVQGTLVSQKEFKSQDLMVGYILGANAHMSSTHVIKELHK